MKPTELLQLLADCYREKDALRRRHVAVARLVGQYDLNNTYQYVVGREEQHGAWLRDAIASAGGEVSAEAPVEVPDRGKGEEAVRGLIREDADALDRFVGTWRQRIAGVGNARHKLMLDLMLGEMLEQARLFHQAAGGELDVLGRRTGGPRTKGEVLPTRWVE